MKLLDLYKSLLKTANLVTTEDGYVSRIFADRKEPAMVGGKRIVLPTPEHLANPNWNDRVVFHPLYENILRGETAIMEHFRKSVVVRLDYTIGIIAIRLLQLATDNKHHATMTPDQSEYLSKVKNADAKTLEVFQKLTKAMSAKKEESGSAFVSIFLKRGGMVDGRKHARVAVVTFPLYHELAKESTKEHHEVFGVKLRVKDREAIMALLAYMFPRISIPESHNRGSDSDVAPNVDALMKAVLSLAAPINDLLTLFHSHLKKPEGYDTSTGDGVEELMFNDEWVETFENLSVMLPEIRMIPMQAGNEGKPKAVTPPVAAPATQGHPSTLHYPGHPVAPTPPPLNQGWQPPVMQPPPPVWGVPAAHQVPVPGVVRTAGGLDFDSLMRSVPGMAMPMQQFSPAGAMQQVPRWAQPQGYVQPQQFGSFQQPIQPGYNNTGYQPGSI